METYFFKIVKKQNLNKIEDFLFFNKDFDVNVKNANEETALILSSKIGNIPIVKYLVENGADINAKDKNGKTALILASKIEIVKFLVSSSHGQAVDINAKDKNGNTALISASRIEDFEIVKYLVENGSDVNAINEQGSTALCIAENYENEEIISYLENAIKSLKSSIIKDAMKLLKSTKDEEIKS